MIIEWRQKLLFNKQFEFRKFQNMTNSKNIGYLDT